ncbi:MAG: hypothetical protein R8L07_21545 [Alphaproteobacteria bacterium]|nr:hypothetical protein [Alphaproteobacteria bacterium]
MRQIKSILLVAGFVPPDFERRYSPEYHPPIRTDSVHVAYHISLFQALRAICPNVIVARSPKDVLTLGKQCDYAVSVYSSDSLSSEESVVAAHCEAIGLPMLCGDALTLALVEDKHACKLKALKRGIPTATWISVSPADANVDWSPVRFPCVVKPRFGMSSEFINEEAVSKDRVTAERRLKRLLHEGQHALVEAFVPGFDVTIACVGDGMQNAQVGWPLKVTSDAPGNIQTRAQKMEGGKGRTRERLDAPHLAKRLNAYCKELYKEFYPLDFFRADFRYNPADDTVAFLELNKPAINPGSNFVLSCSRDESFYVALVADLVKRGAARHGMTLSDPA